jgi:hypothetical protein
MSNLTWDYSGANGKPEFQYNWNDTLVTPINQASSTIRKFTNRYSADTIIANPCLKPLLKTMTFYHESPDGDSIGGRFKIQYSDDVNQRQLIVKYDHTKDVHGDFCIIPESNGIEISVKLVNIISDSEKYNDYVNNLSIIIDIENLSDEELENLKNN